MSFVSFAKRVTVFSSRVFFCDQGIFRVSAAKSRVESLFQKLKSEDDMIDLSSESPHTIAGLIRQYLREAGAAAAALD